VTFLLHEGLLTACLRVFIEARKPSPTCPGAFPTMAGHCSLIRGKSWMMANRIRQVYPA